MSSAFVRLASTSPWENSVGLRLSQITIKLNVFASSHTYYLFFLWICNLTNLTIVKMVWVCSYYSSTTGCRIWNRNFSVKLHGRQRHFPFHLLSRNRNARPRPFNRINKHWNCIVPHHKCEKIRNDIALKLIWQQSTCHQFKCTWRTNKHHTYRPNRPNEWTNERTNE